MASTRSSLKIESCIQVDKERIGRKRALIHGIRFNLDEDTLERIQRDRDTGCNLKISRELLADLRYYALIEGENRLQSGLTFCTYYRSGDSEEALVRSVISTDGDIIHQIQSKCLERPDFCHQIVSAHYWLVDELLYRLRLRALIRLTVLSWVLSLVSVAATLIPYVHPLMQVNPWALLLPVLMSWLLQVVIQRLLRWFLPPVGRWALRRIFLGLLSRKLRTKQLAKGILGWLVP